MGVLANGLVSRSVPIWRRRMNRRCGPRVSIPLIAESGRAGGEGYAFAFACGTFDAMRLITFLFGCVSAVCAYLGAVQDTPYIMPAVTWLLAAIERIVKDR